jgi:hypothetical protein
LGRLGVDGDEGDVNGEAVSVGRGNGRSTKFEAAHVTGEESTGAVGVLATMFIGISGTCGERVRAGNKGAG